MKSPVKEMELFLLSTGGRYKDAFFGGQVYESLKF
jgi:hypothetical protein